MRCHIEHLDFKQCIPITKRLGRNLALEIRCNKVLDLDQHNRPGDSSSSSLSQTCKTKISSPGSIVDPLVSSRGTEVNKIIRHLIRLLDSHG